MSPLALPFAFGSTAFKFWHSSYEAQLRLICTWVEMMRVFSPALLHTPQTPPPVARPVRPTRTPPARRAAARVSPQPTATPAPARAASETLAPAEPAAPGPAVAKSAPAPNPAPRRRARKQPATPAQPFK
ncbi:hypothetical protein CCR78_10230 [Rhodovulum imhoffii]|nr:hypothetical protein [Rhodovulum imhoffii]